MVGLPITEKQKQEQKKTEPAVTPAVQAWNSHGPSRPLVFLPDRPSVNIMKRKGDTKRTLKIKIKVTSAKDCGCANKSVELEIEQKLVVESYRPVWDKSYLEINGKKHDFK